MKRILNLLLLGNASLFAAHDIEEIMQAQGKRFMQDVDSAMPGGSLEDSITAHAPAEGFYEKLQEERARIRALIERNQAELRKVAEAEESKKQTAKNEAYLALVEERLKKAESAIAIRDQLYKGFKGALKEVCRRTKSLPCRSPSPSCLVRS